MNEFSFALDNSTLYSDDYLAHHGILGMHWGKRNGPPYPLGSDDHSSEQKAAARKAGIKVGGSSGKGSIENLDPSSSSSRVDTTPKEQPEEHKETPEEHKETPEEHEAKRKAALASGDKEQIKKYATESSYAELNEALNKANLMKKLNEIPDPPKPKPEPEPEPQPQQSKEEHKPDFYEKLGDVTTKMNTVYKFAMTAKDIYNFTADVRNTLTDDPKKKWKKIGSGDGKKKKEAQHSFSGRNEFYSNLDVEPIYLVHYDFFDSQVDDHNQFSFNLSSDYLEHHGVLRQKWGVRNGPPYPLKRRVSYNGPTPGSDTSRKTKAKIKIGTNVAFTALGIALFPVSPLSSIASSVWNIPVTAISIANYAKANKKAKQADEKASRFAEERTKSPVDKSTGLHKKTKQMTMEEDMERINPGYDNWDENTKNNCAYCTMTYELRRRGYDVAAKTSLKGMDDKDVNEYFPKAKTITDIKGNTEAFSREDLIRKETKFPTKGQKEMVHNFVDELSKDKNARGFVGIRWAGSLMGHAIAYEVNNGVVTFLDTQSNEKFNGDDLNNIGNIGDLEYIRLDNVALNKNKIKEICD